MSSFNNGRSRYEGTELLFVDSKTMLVSNTSIFEEQNLVDVFLLAKMCSIDLKIGEAISGRDDEQFYS